MRGQDLNLRPSGYEPDELPGCSTPRYVLSPRKDGGCSCPRYSWMPDLRLDLYLVRFPKLFQLFKNLRFFQFGLKQKSRFWERPLFGPKAKGLFGEDVSVCVALCRPGSDLLSRVLRRSTIGAGAFHGRVRNGNGCSHPAITTRSAKCNI